MVTAETYHMRQCRCNVTFMWKVNSGEKTRFFHWEISGSCNITTVTAPYYPISSLLSVSARLREVKNKRKFQTFSSKSGRGRLREVIAYKRFPMQWFGRKTFGIQLENWSMRRGDRLQEVVATGGSTVFNADHIRYRMYRPKKRSALETQEKLRKEF